MLVTNECWCVVAGGGPAGPAGAAEDEDEGDDVSGYSAAYAKLANASRPERPVLTEIPDPRQYLETSLARMFSTRQ